VRARVQVYLSVVTPLPQRCHYVQGLWATLRLRCCFCCSCMCVFVCLSICLSSLHCYSGVITYKGCGQHCSCAAASAAAVCVVCVCVCLRVRVQVYLSVVTPLPQRCHYVQGLWATLQLCCCFCCSCVLCVCVRVRVCVCVCVCRHYTACVTFFPFSLSVSLTSALTEFFWPVG